MANSLDPDLGLHCLLRFVCKNNQGKYSKCLTNFDSACENSTIFILSIGTPYLLNILVLKFEIFHYTTFDVSEFNEILL